ncbi:MAG: 16S rRNA (guanine(966)-N(2))-methyltransferase RsmD [Lachnospiraceae bacterium]
MRVIAGSAKSLPLKVQTGTDTRPTTDRIKETLFNMLQPFLADSIFVDLFSGSGAIGIEALSRGAGICYFVENNPKAISCIQENLSFTRLEKKAIVIKQDVFASLQRIPQQAVDVIFLDPPYDLGYEQKVLESLSHLSYVTNDTLIVMEVSLHTTYSYLPELGFEICKEKTYKTNKHIFLKRR